MKLLLQRIKEGKVTVKGEEIGAAGPGLCLFLAVAKGDTEKEVDYLVEKALTLRIFEDEMGKLNRSLLDINGELLIVSEFTLYGDCAKGRRPSFTQAASLEEAEKLYDCFVKKMAGRGLKMATGKFQAKMEVALVNDGPVTFMLEAITNSHKTTGK